MTKLKPYIFWILVLLVGLIVGVFKFQNLARVEIDSLFSATPLDLALGDALVGAFVLGFILGVLLLGVHWMIQRLELSRLRRQLQGLEKQLAKAREVVK